MSKWSLISPSQTGKFIPQKLSELIKKFCGLRIWGNESKIYCDKNTWGKVSTCQGETNVHFWTWNTWGVYLTSKWNYWACGYTKEYGVHRSRQRQKYTLLYHHQKDGTYDHQDEWHHLGNKFLREMRRSEDFSKEPWDTQTLVG